jgi:hypothetical protein
MNAIGFRGGGGEMSSRIQGNAWIPLEAALYVHDQEQICFELSLGLIQRLPT